MTKRKKSQVLQVGTIRPIDLLQHASGKLNKGSDALVRQGTGVQESKKRKVEMKKKTTRQYLSDYGRVIQLSTAKPACIPVSYSERFLIYTLKNFLYDCIGRIYRKDCT